MRRAALLLPLFLLLPLVACAPCSDYCTEECRCADTETSECVDSCLETMDLYSGDAREDECTERLEVLDDEGCPAIQSTETR